jgi:hypothetical protein
MTKKPEMPPLPPEGLWIAPSGEKIHVTEHLEAIRNHPRSFGLLEREVCSNDIRCLRDIAVILIRSGWVRFRTLDLTFHFEVESLDLSNKIIIDVLDSVSTCPGAERVAVTELRGKRTVAGTVAEFKAGELQAAEPEDLLQHRQWAFSSESRRD